MSASKARKIVEMYRMIEERDEEIGRLRHLDRLCNGLLAENSTQLRIALQEADTLMGHSDEATEWREKWAGLWVKPCKDQT